MTFDLVLIALTCLVVVGPILARKLLNLFIDWIEQKQWERRVDRFARSGR